MTVDGSEVREEALATIGGRYAILINSKTMLPLTFAGKVFFL